MGASEAAIFTVQETFKKSPTVLTDKDIKQENFGLLNELIAREDGLKSKKKELQKLEENEIKKKMPHHYYGDDTV